MGTLITSLLEDPAKKGTEPQTRRDRDQSPAVGSKAQVADMQRQVLDYQAPVSGRPSAEGWVKGFWPWFLCGRQKWPSVWCVCVCVLGRLTKQF